MRTQNPSIKAILCDFIWCASYQVMNKKHPVMQCFEGDTIVCMPNYSKLKIFTTPIRDQMNEMENKSTHLPFFTSLRLRMRTSWLTIGTKWEDGLTMESVCHYTCCSLNNNTATVGGVLCIVYSYCDCVSAGLIILSFACLFVLFCYFHEKNVTRPTDEYCIWLYIFACLFLLNTFTPR